jgi:hypothetical protein
MNAAFALIALRGNARASSRTAIEVPRLKEGIAITISGERSSIRECERAKA